MFKSISWQEYLYVIGLIAAGYYVVIVAVFYSRDIIGRLKGATVPKAKSNPSNQISSKEKFMGATSNAPAKKIPVKQTVATSEEIIIESDPEELLSAQRADSPAAELYDRLESLFLIMKTEKVKKANYMKSIKTLIIQYPLFKGTPIQEEITNFIFSYVRDNGETNISIEEIHVLWFDEREELIYQSTTKNNYEK